MLQAFKAVRKTKKLQAFLRKVDARLRMYGDDRHGNLDEPLDELVFILLSAQTEEYLYRKTFQDLKDYFSEWEQLLDAPEEKIAQVIRHGGLSRKKASQLKGAFRQIHHDIGRLSLDFLRDMSDEEALQYLTSLPGIGAKSAKCILMYSLARPVFPVDTHVWRVSRRLGITPPVPKANDVQKQELEQLVPEDLRYRLHVNMISHGRQTCTVYWPKCDDCVLADMCPSKGLSDVIWSQWRQPQGVWRMASEESSHNSRTATSTKLDKCEPLKDTKVPKKRG